MLGFHYLVQILGNNYQNPKFLNTQKTQPEIFELPECPPIGTRSVQFTRHSLIWHGLLNYNLIIHLFYTIIFMIINLGLLDSTFDYKSIHIKLVL